MLDQSIQCIRVHRYGGPEELTLEKVGRPVPQADEVLIKVQAAGVNPVDWKIRQGYLKDFRPMTFPYIPGFDLAGDVEAVGPGVTAFQKGQAVFGQSAHGSYTQYAIASIRTLALKPEPLSYDEAAAIPIGAATAWQGLFDHGNLRAGQRVLIQGGAGGVGLFAVQFAHMKGAHVVATTSTPNVEFVRSLGANEVIDYTKVLVESVLHDVDLVFDTVGGKALASSLQAVKRGGTLVTITGPVLPEKAQERNVHVVGFSVTVTSQLLRTFAQLIADGRIKVFVREIFPLREARQAQEASQKGHGRGRIVLRVGE